MTLQRVPRSTIAQILEDSDADISAQQQHEMAITTYTHSNGLIRWLMWRRYELIDDLLAIGPSGSVLEFGCGAGVFLPTLASNFGRVYAADLLPQYAQALSDSLTLGVTFVDKVADLPDQSLDAVVAADVLEHFEDPSSMILELRSKLVETGLFVVSGPTENAAYQLGRRVADLGRPERSCRFTGHYHYLNILELDTLIQSCGFERVDMRALPFRLLPSLFRVVAYRPANDVSV